VSDRDRRRAPSWTRDRAGGATWRRRGQAITAAARREVTRGGAARLTHVDPSTTRAFTHQAKPNSSLYYKVEVIREKGLEWVSAQVAQEVALVAGEGAVVVVCGSRLEADQMTLVSRCASLAPARRVACNSRSPSRSAIDCSDHYTLLRTNECRHYTEAIEERLKATRGKVA